jgi:RND family efflux transporter MFP subunit
MVMLAGCLDTDEEKTQTQKPKIVKTLHLSQAVDVEQTFEYPGHVEALQDTVMAFEVSGKIVAFNFKEGEKVSKGDTIAKLDDTIYKANYDSAKANYEQAQNDFERYKKLYETKAVSQMAFEQHKQNLEVTKAAFEVAKKNFEDTKLKADFDGVIAKKLVADFARVTAKEPIVRLQDNSAYKIKFYVPETDMTKTKGKDRVKDISKLVDIYVTLGDLKKHKATLLDSSTVADEVTRTFEATVKIQKPKNTTILPGMTANVEVFKKSQNEQKLFIPYKAVFSNNTAKAFVWVVDENNRVNKKEIQTKRLSGESVEVVAGLTKDAEIVTSGVRFLNENDLITRYEKLGD